MLRTLTEKIKAGLGYPSTPEVKNSKRVDLAVMATAHNFAEIMSVILFLIILAAEAVCVAMGLSARGALADVGTEIQADRLRVSGMTKGWRGDIPAKETAVVLLIVLVCRIVGTLVEEKIGSARFGPRRGHVKKFLQLLLQDGPLRFRIMCYALTLGQIFIVPAEMA